MTNDKDELPDTFEISPFRCKGARHSHNIPKVYNLFNESDQPSMKFFGFHTHDWYDNKMISDVQKEIEKKAREEKERNKTILDKYQAKLDSDRYAVN